ncbi:hypothetical protein ACFS5L_42655 [Streptomyces phyllanthi]|uniref:hypothetical protein n=1 Tax=Streptomyces phyllanthi TaxID=1803180 RepID=UPI0018841A8E|nr:hypothetical protein [Streptomyces phyllanthi]
MASGERADAVSRFGGFGDWKRTVVSRMRGRARDAGAGFVEYAGIMIIVAGIFVMIDGLGLDGQISGAIATAVGNVIGG